MARSSILFVLAVAALGSAQPLAAEKVMDKRAYGAASSVAPVTLYETITNIITSTVTQYVTVEDATTTTSSPAASATSTSTSEYIESGAVTSANITEFLGTNSNGIMSWYHTDSTTDSTNGHSWCGFPYDDSIPGFAPDVTTMLGDYGNDYVEAATAYCGLEAEVTLANGKTALLYIADGFDHTWVRTPASIDVIYDSFMSLYGSDTSDKNVVFQGVSWKLTGNRDTRLTYKGVGSAGF